MSQEGHLTFFSTREQPTPFALTSALIRDIIGAERTWLVSRTRREDRSWERWQRIVASHFMLDDDPEPWESLGKGFSPEEAGAEFRPDRCLIIMFIETLLAKPFDEHLRRIDERIRGQFVPTDCILMIGWHDIWEAAEHDHGQLFGRAFVSLSIRGNSSPNDWPEYRRLVLREPVVLRLQERLESILGPVEKCIYWGV
jgi:hypothetical protein